MKYIPINDGCQYVSGIYLIKAKCGKFYVGSAATLMRRFCTHRYNLSNGNHHNIFLQRYHDKHGSDSIDFFVIELCDKSKLIDREQFYIDTMHPEFNLNKTAGSRLGSIITDSTRIKMSDSRKKALLNPELIERIRKASTGRKQTDSAKKKLSAARKGIKRPQYNRGLNPKAKVCKNIKTGETISNATDLAKILGYSRQWVTDQLSGRRSNKTDWRYVD